ncbi:MAG TPA: hypothetical protein PLG20_06700 [Candidatus Syntrophosphaera sp.]|nr:hypothetical protein [Candidatus Syntrophosphaera sp.]
MNRLKGTDAQDKVIVPGHVITYDTRIQDGVKYDWGHCSCGTHFRWTGKAVVESYMNMHLQDTLKANLKQQGKK